MMSRAKMGGSICTISSLCDLFLHKELLFGVAIIASTVKFLVAIIFLKSGLIP